MSIFISAFKGSSQSKLQRLCNLAIKGCHIDSFGVLCLNTRSWARVYHELSGHIYECLLKSVADIQALKRESHNITYKISREHMDTLSNHKPDRQIVGRVAGVLEFAVPYKGYKEMVFSVRPESVYLIFLGENDEILQKTMRPEEFPSEDSLISNFLSFACYMSPHIDIQRKVAVINLSKHVKYVSVEPSIILDDSWYMKAQHYGTGNSLRKAKLVDRDKNGKVTARKLVQIQKEGAEAPSLFF
jgi:hypothetical protein